MHVADDTPIKSKRELHGQNVVDTLSLSVWELNWTRIASPLSARRDDVIDGAGGRDADCNNLTATVALEYRFESTPEKERDTLQLAVISVSDDR